MTVAAISAVFGVLREVVVAAEFGTTAETDAYFFSFDLIVRLPEFLMPAVAGALIPIYMRSREESGDNRFVLSVLNTYMIALTIFSATIAVLAPGVVAIMGSGFPSEQRPLVVGIIRILAPSMTLLGIAGVLRSLLQADNKFFVAQLSNVWLSIGIVVGAIYAVPHLGINGLPVGAVGGAAFQVVWTWYWVRRSGFQYRFVIDIRDQRFKRFLTLLGPAVLGATLSWLVPVIDKFLATFLEEGAIATLSFGGRPIGLLSRIFINSIVIAALPVFTAKALLEDPTEYRQSVQRTLSTLVFILVPTSLVLAALRVPVIEILFERGAFDSAAVARTAGVFAAGVLVLAPAAIGVVLSTGFTAMEDTKTPAIFGAGTNVIVKATVAPLLMMPLGVAGIALSSTFMYATSSLVLLMLFNRRVFDLRRSALGRSIVRALVAGAAAGVAVEWMTRVVDTASLLKLVLGVTLGAVLYLVVSALLRSPELTLLKERYGTFRTRDQ